MKKNTLIDLFPETLLRCSVKFGRKVRNSSKRWFIASAWSEGGLIAITLCHRNQSLKVTSQTVMFDPTDPEENSYDEEERRISWSYSNKRINLFLVEEDEEIVRTE